MTGANTARQCCFVKLDHNRSRTLTVYDWSHTDRGCLANNSNFQTLAILSQIYFQLWKSVLLEVMDKQHGLLLEDFIWVTFKLHFGKQTSFISCWKMDDKRYKVVLQYISKPRSNITSPAPLNITFYILYLICTGQLTLFPIWMFF